MAPRKKTIIPLGPLLWVCLIFLVTLAPQSCTYDADKWFFHQFFRLQNPNTDGSVQLLRSQQEPPETRTETYEHRYVVCPTVGTVRLDQATVHESFAATPLGPQDFAVLINKVADHGAEALAVSSPLVWNEVAGPMAQEMLCQVMGRFKAASFGLRGRMAAQADFTPVVLRNYSIPQENISGDPSGLPAANRALPNGLSETPDAIKVDWAPDWLEDEPLTQAPSALANISYPLLMRWNGETMPTLPLRLAMRKLNIEPRQVKVELGKQITLGKRVLPLDEHGRTRIQQASISEIPLEDLITQGESIKKLGSGATVVMEQPVGADQAATRLDQLALTISELLGTEHREQHTRQVQAHAGLLLPVHLLPAGTANHLMALVALLVLILLLRYFPAWLRTITMLTMLVLLMNQAWVCTARGQWFPLTVYCAAWMLLWIAGARKRKRKTGIFH